ncbi:MAG: o-succinylbenzoate--CoA ligase [bacterium]|nr:o-succinylbenzoate--CoA ligase [bacterium]
MADLDWRTPWLRARAERTPDAPALVFAGETHCYAQLAARVDAVAHALSGVGVARHDVVAAHLPNGLPMVELVHAAFARDFTLQLVNGRLNAAEIEFQLCDSGAQHFVHLAGDETAEAVRLEPGVRRLRVGDRNSARSIATQLSVADAEVTRVCERIDLTTPRFILYTAGTSGRPKGVALDASNLLSSAQGSAKLLGANASDRWLLCLPIFHVGGLSILLRSVLAGCTVVLHERFDPEAVARDLDREGITGISLVANMLARILEVRGTAKAPRSLACVLLGGGPAPAPLREAARRAGFPVAPTYGLTEAASQVATRPPGEGEDRGLRPLPGTRVRIEDDAGRVLGPGESGEICVHGQSVTKGYWRKPEATREALRGGWLHTGDIGTLDRDGELHVFDRRSDLIISGGENVYPAEIESVLLAHPAVEEAGVAGEEDEVYGARPVAWLVCCTADPPGSDELRAFCHQRLAAFKCPVKFHFVDTLPRNAVGKLVRRQLGK